MSKLLAMVEGYEPTGPGHLFGQDLHLAIIDKDGGAEITVSWPPPRET